jgi:hypothetical protein
MKTRYNVSTFHTWFVASCCLYLTTTICNIIHTNNNNDNNNSFLFISGYTTGAGSCDGEKAAVGGYHVTTSNDRQVIGKALIDGKVGVQIDGTYIEPDSVITLQTQTDYNLRVETPIDPGFKGILLRLEAADSNTDNEDEDSGTIIDTTTALIPADATIMKLSERCEAPIIGLTHINNETKKFVEALMRLDEPSNNVRLDITIVAVNDERGSVYGYNSFLFQFEGDTKTDNNDTPLQAPVVTGPTTASPTINVNLLVNDIQGSLAPTNVKNSQSTTSGSQRKCFTTPLPNVFSIMAFSIITNAVLILLMAVL